MTDLTQKEKEVLAAFLNEGCAVNGATTAEGILEDNMTWMNADDLKDELGWSKQSIGGVMASLEAKGMIVNSQESERDGRLFDWSASDEAISKFFEELINGEELTEDEKCWGKRTPVAQAVYDYAIAHYGKSGWDIVVETWDREELNAAVAKNKSVNSAIKKVRAMIRPLANRRDEVRAEIF